jgi:hypothetical protein
MFRIKNNNTTGKKERTNMSETNPKETPPKEPIKNEPAKNETPDVWMRILFIGLIAGIFTFSWLVIDKMFPKPDSNENRQISSEETTLETTFHKQTYDLFNDQFARLLGVFTLLVTCFGIAMPVAAYLMQRQSLKEVVGRKLQELEQDVARGRVTMSKLEEADKNVENMVKKAENMLSSTEGSIANHKLSEQEMIFERGHLYQDLAFALFENKNYLPALSSSLRAIKTFGKCINSEKLQSDAEKNITSCFDQFKNKGNAIAGAVEEHPKYSDRLKDLVREALEIEYCRNTPSHKATLLEVQAILNKEPQGIKS